MIAIPDPAARSGAGAEMPRAYFRRALAAGRLSHAYLFLGPEGSGKRRFAAEVARSLFCERRDGCGECLECRKAEHGNHPGISVYGPAAGKTLIDIDTVRELCDRSHYARDHAFVAILEGAELLNEPAANALLKTLEEPPGEFIVILTAPSSGALLPTIVSRCHRLYFAGVERREEDSVAWPELAQIAQGKSFYQNDLRQWLGRVVPAAGNARERLRALLGASIAAARAELDASSPPRVDALLERLESLLELRRALDGNVSPDLVLERFLAGAVPAYR